MSENKFQINKESTLLFLKGVAMGSADIVPGVSGGTVAFITGIYEKLINAIKAFDSNFFKLLFSFKIKAAIERIELKFLLTLFAGIVVAVLSVSRLVSYFLHNHPEHTWSLFFGLILASIFILSRDIKKIIGVGGIGILLGTIIGYGVVGLIPITTPEAWWFIVLSGMIAISAMILPGLSGAFILLLLGKYEFMLEALKNPFVAENFIIVVLFIFGCASGIMLFSRAVAYLFKKNHNLTVAILTGLIIGSLRKIWPWKEVLKEKIIDGEVFVILEKNILPDITLSTACQVSLILIGFLFVILLNKKAKKGTSLV